MSNGKWKNMMSDIHIGYKMWSMPRTNTMPSVVDITPLSQPSLGVAIEGSELVWPNSTEKAILPVFDGLKKSTYYIDVFNKGIGSFSFEVTVNKPWIKLSTTKGNIEKEQRLQVSIDWSLLPEGKSDGLIEIEKRDSLVQVQVNAIKGSFPKTKETFFGSLTGEFSIPAIKYNAIIASKNATWVSLPDLGRSEGCMGIYPVTAPSTTPQSAPELEYKIFLNQSGKTTLLLGILPTQDVYPQRGLQIAIAIDNGEPQILDARKGLVDTFGEYTEKNLANSKVLKALPPVNKDIKLIGNGKLRRNEIFDNIRWLDAQFDVDKAGFHTIKIFMVDPEIVLERIIVNPDNKYPSYFGTPAKQFGEK
jgi:hypothetical protein